MAKTLLSQSKQVLEQIINNALDAFVLIDSASKVVAWTRRAEALFGWQAEEALGQYITTLIIPAEFRQAHMDGMARYLKTQQTVVLGKRIEVPAQHKDGHRLLVELSVSLIEADGEPVFSAALRDITERKRIEEQFRGTFEQAAVGIAHIGLDRRILRVNAKICEILGYSRQELLALEPQAITHPNDLDVGTANLQQLLAGTVTSSSYEKRYIHKSGRVIWIKVTASLLHDVHTSEKYFICVGEDITEGKRLQDHVNRMAAVIEATPDFVGFSSIAGAAEYINRAGRQMIGMPLDMDLQGVSVADKYPAWAFELVCNGIESAKQTGAWRGETALLSATGEEIPASQVLIVHKDQDGQPKYMSTIIRDMTEYKKKEQALREADRRKDEFLAMLAHELRNPLAPISTAAQILKLGKLEDSRVRQTSDIIARQVSHMTELIDDLLDVSRVTRGLITIQKESLDINNIVTDAVEQVRSLVKGRHHQLTVQTTLEQVCVHADKTRMVQVIVNLLNNAAKYTPEYGEIALKIDARADEVIVRVMDNGIGIPPDIQPYVFDLFVQGKRSPDRSQGGLGLGLALVKSLVELHHGSIAVRSEGLGKGSEFTLRLPRLRSHSVAQQGLSISASVHASHALRVMIVDDNVDAAQTLGLFLEAHGHQVRMEHRVAQALEQITILRPDALLLDIGLPEINGYELARRIRELPGMTDATLVAITGYGQPEDIKQAEQAGFNHHMLKPVDTAKLLALLGAISKEKEHSQSPWPER